jgi:hypothetical protein
MEPQHWVELLFTYGPYAAIVLFLSVALYLLKIWRRVRSKDRVQQIVYGFYTFASWLVVIIAVWYMYLNWPPITVYAGSLGVHEAIPAKFYSNSPYLFVQSTATSDGRHRWEFVVVIRQPTELSGFDFTYQWGAEKEQFGDYHLELAELKQGHTKVTEDADHKLFYDTGGATAAKRPVQIADARHLSRPTAQVAIFIGAANAQERLRTDILLRWLDSSDPNLRSQARAQLRQLPPEDLRKLLSSPGLSDFARQQIEAQLRGVR